MVVGCGSPMVGPDWDGSPRATPTVFGAVSLFLSMARRVSTEAWIVACEQCATRRWGRGVAHDLPVGSQTAGATRDSEAGLACRWGGHGEGLRRSCGDAAGAKLGAGLI